ncbi:FecR family protein [Variovorax sp. GB1P17]|uniref:FecR family protein n=1 Tax=Variovorax sp. GB1P17 TaxID=3443740 RepID=UPI003F46B481
MTSRPVTDDHAQHQPDRDGVREDAHASGDALDASLAELNATEAEALRWLVRRADGLDAAAEADFQAWLHADPAHQTAFDDMAGVWQGIDSIPADGVAQLKAAVASARSDEQMGVPPGPAPQAHWQPRPTRHSSPRRWLPGITQWAPKALAACVAFALLGGGWFAWDHGQHQPVFSQHYATARGQQVEARLPDGSTLRLDTASQADVTLYRQRREVRLPEGQIMFTVQGDKARPFDVLAGAMRITVVGTRFSVRYTPSLGSDQVQVAVEEGHVRVARADAVKGRGGSLLAAPVGDAIDLEAGQTVAADGEGRLGPVGQVAAEGIAPWRGNRVNFDNTPLTMAVAELERYGSTGLLVRDPAVAALRVTGSVDVRRVGDFVRSLPQVLPVQLEPREGAVEVESRRP